jgi:hypothetical protein
MFFFSGLFNSGNNFAGNLGVFYIHGDQLGAEESKNTRND